MKKVLTKIVAAFLLLASGSLTNRAIANNLTITGTSVSGSDITFNISWDNSWNASLAPSNWDGVWVFVKYQDCATRLWYHAGLSTVGGDHSAGAPLQVDPVTDGKGVFIRRAAFGGGSTGSVAISLKMTIAAGTYNYTSLSISGNGRLSATGAVTIYVSGSISIAGNGISTSSSKPPNMLIYETGTSSVSLSGNANLYAGIYAPNSAVTNSGNGTLYGAVVSNTYTQTGNGAIHFDQALQSVGGSGTTATMLSWNESNLSNS